MKEYSAYSFFSGMGARGILNWIPDRIYLCIQYYLKMHKPLNLNHPSLLSEKLQWLKLYDRKQQYTGMVDKIAVRAFVSQVIGDEYLIPMLGVWEYSEEIDFDSLPDQFVLKCNHDSGGVVVCRDKKEIDRKKTKDKLTAKLNRDYSWGNREWPYKHIKHRVYCEQYMADNENGQELTDYKFYCFNGKAEYVQACVERATGNPQFYFFDKEWNLLRYNDCGQNAPVSFTITPPGCLSEMYEVANALAFATTAAFVRIDLYCAANKIYFGEITFYPHSGMDRSLLPEIDKMFGEKVILPQVTQE